MQTDKILTLRQFTKFTAMINNIIAISTTTTAHGLQIICLIVCHLNTSDISDCMSKSIRLKTLDQQTG